MITNPRAVDRIAIRDSLGGGFWRLAGITEP